MKLSRLFGVLTLALMIFSSCSKESTEGGDEVFEGKETYMGFDISISKSQTKAPNTDAGTDAEKKINTLGVYLWDETAGRLDSKIFDIDKFTHDGSGNYSAKEAVKTVVGMKKVFVVANPTEVVRSRVYSMRGAALNPVPFGVDQGEFINSDGSMVMSGIHNNGTEVEAKLKDRQEAIDNPTSLSIERNLAKVVMRQGSSYEVIGGTTTLQFVPIATANDAHFLPQTSTLYSKIPDGADVDKTHAYFDNFSSILTAGRDDFLPINELTDTEAYRADGFYCFENKTAENLSGSDVLHLKGNTTAVRIKGQFVPDASKVLIIGSYDAATGERTKGALGADGSFWTLNEDNSYWSKAAYDEAIKAGVHQIAPTKFSEKYVEGYGYYTVAIQDNNGDKGVLRNAFYLMDVNKVIGPGSPTEEDNKEDPYKEDVYMAVSVTVKAWDFYNTEHDIQ